MKYVSAPFDNASQPLIIGHRGANNLAPENTLVSICKAVELGATWVEVDVRLSADNVPVVFHDQTLERTTNSKGLVKEYTLKSLKELDAGSWYDPIFYDEKIPTLSETIHLCIELNLGLNIEIKGDLDGELDIVEAILPIVDKNKEKLKNLILFSSFCPIILGHLLRLGPEWPRGLLVNTLMSNWQYQTKKFKCYSLNPAFECLTGADDIAKILDTGLKVIPYTVNEIDVANRLLKFGVSSLITDDLKIIREINPN